MLLSGLFYCVNISTYKIMPMLREWSDQRYKVTSPLLDSMTPPCNSWYLTIKT